MTRAGLAVWHVCADGIRDAESAVIVPDGNVQVAALEPPIGPVLFPYPC